jgi:hypothetical protein
MPKKKVINKKKGSTEEELENDDSVQTDISDVESDDDVVISKHKKNDKHRLSYDTIFKGKKDDIDEVDDYIFVDEGLSIDKSTVFYFETQSNESYVREKKVKERVYEILLTLTDLNFLNSRRKPSTDDFNKYFFILKTHLVDDGFTNVEIFNELSVYFSDNLFNMFKLLDNKYRVLIVDELQKHIGKQSPTALTIRARNLHVSTEVEFKWIVSGEEKSYTGIIIELDHEENYYKINSFENIYEIEMEDITKIISNNRYKYNLNKINNIDFL